MRLRVPLYLKVLLWFFVNLALVGLLAAVFARVQFRLGLEWLLAGPGRQRLEAMGEVIAGELRDQPVSAWDEATARYGEAHGASFTIFRNDGQQVAGAALQPPPEVLEKLRDRRGPRGPRLDERAETSRQSQAGPVEPKADSGPPPARVEFILRTENPTRYWVGVHLGLTHRGPREARPVTLLLMSDRITGRGLFFDPLPWLGLGVLAIVVSALVWLPIVGGISRAIRRVNSAARKIAEGRFDVRVPDSRRDELGELGGSVNAMAAQLGELLEKQRRLTADVAHELCSPIARMQRALGVLEQRSVPEQSAYLEKLDRELQHMARLVEEVLSFSKAATLPSLAEAEDFSLGDLVAEVVAREAPEAAVSVEISPSLRVHTFREALDRALSNLLRNALRYAAQGGAIEVRARSVEDALEITVEDHGPGVPAAALGKIFEPFYRPEAARQRTTGGIGLGLAIVKRCVEACSGTVAASLRVPNGLCVLIRLPLHNVSVRD